MKNGLPVTPFEDYQRLYETDVRHFGEDVSATYDYRGYVHFNREPGENKTLYRDVLATNGVLKELGGKGVHIGTDGVLDYTNGMPDRESQGPESIHEYNIYINVPPETQKAQNVFVLLDGCFPVEGKPSYMDEEDVTYAQGRDGYIVMRLDLDPAKDPLARKKAHFIHESIVQHLQNKGSLADVEKLVYQIMRRLRQAEGQQKAA